MLKFNKDESWFNENGSINIPEHIQKVLVKKNNIENRNIKKKHQLNNTFFRNFVFNIYKNKCRKCGTEDNLKIHHKRYNWECPYEEKITDCEQCYNNENKLFPICISCVELLCKSCHTKEHKSIKKYTGDWVGLCTTKKTEDSKPRCHYCDNPVEEGMLYCLNCPRKVKLTEEETKKHIEETDQRWKICQKIKKEGIDIYYKSIEGKKISEYEIKKDIIIIKNQAINNFCSDKSNKELEEINKQKH